MGKSEIELKIFKNKKNNQFSMTLPKKDVDFLNCKKVPKKIKLKLKDVELIF